jgi:hypothetical protein
MKKLFLIFLLGGCFPSFQEIQTKCAQNFDPRQDKELYLHCVDSQVNDVKRRREDLADAIRRSGEGFKTTTNCSTTCNFGTCYTTCH